MWNETDCLRLNSFDILPMKLWCASTFFLYFVQRSSSLTFESSVEWKYKEDTNELATSISQWYFLYFSFYVRSNAFHSTTFAQTFETNSQSRASICANELTSLSNIWIYIWFNRCSRLSLCNWYKSSLIRPINTIINHLQFDNKWDIRQKSVLNLVVLIDGTFFAWIRSQDFHFHPILCRIPFQNLEQIERKTRQAINFDKKCGFLGKSVTNPNQNEFQKVRSLWLNCLSSVNLPFGFGYLKSLIELNPISCT